MSCFFEGLEHATLALEGGAGTLNKTLPMMDFVLELFEKHEAIHSNDPHMLSLLHKGWEKMKKYYGLTSKSPAYAAAVVLDPSQKWDYLEKAWESDWLPPARAAVEKLWNEEYRLGTPGTPGYPTNIDPALFSTGSQTSAKETKTPNLFTQYLKEKRAARLVTNSPALLHI
jgi:hypothetical protein